MSGLYVYAVVDERPPNPVGRGLAREKLLALPCGCGLFAVAGRMKQAPPLRGATLRGHDAAVRRLAEGAEAILPVRFGSFLADEAALRGLLEPYVKELGQALALVRGRVQMTLRVYGPEAPAARPAGEGADLGPGTGYLARRRGAAAAKEDPAIARLRAALEGLVRAERLESHPAPPLLASIYHLVQKGSEPSYLEAVRGAAAAMAPVRVTASGPWAPYAFAPEALL